MAEFYSARGWEIPPLPWTNLSPPFSLVGAQMRYAVHDRDGWPLAMLGFSTAAWKLAPRDNFIGWTRQLCNALRRSRRQKTAIKSLSRENARLRKAAKTSRGRIETLEAQLARLRATGAVLSKALFGRKSEQQEKPRSERPRGQQPGGAGHGRTQRLGLEERTEELNPPEDARVCSCCGQPYAPNGTEESTIVEIEIRAHTRRIVRPRWRRSCDCASAPLEVSAPPVPRLFDNTLYGISVWACFLFERYGCFRPLNRVGAWLSDRGLLISPGTLADSVPRFVPLFEPLADAILAHQNKSALRHADETTWRVQALRETGRSSRAWLWTSVSSDAVYSHIDPSRSAEAAEKLFAEAPFDEWTGTFGSERLTGALLDRLTHHVNILEMNGDSYRLSQSRARRNSAAS